MLVVFSVWCLLLVCALTVDNVKLKSILDAYHSHFLFLESNVLSDNIIKCRTPNAGHLGLWWELRAVNKLKDDQTIKQGETDKVRNL